MILIAGMRIVRCPAVAAFLFVAAAAQTPATLPPDVLETFREGRAALEHGDLEAAAQAFRSVVSRSPNTAGAHADLGVVYMRQRRWEAALDELRTAERLAPREPSIRLNIGLAFYRQQRFREAIPPLESVVRDNASSAEAQYLLGLCYFLSGQYAASIPHLEAVWPEQSSHLPYLYTLAVAAGRTGNEDLDRRASARMREVGQDSAELHLFIGETLLARRQFEEARAELTKCTERNPSLPLAHYYLGFIARNLGDIEGARAEYQKEAEIDPDLALNYDQLGAVSYQLGDTAASERAYRRAVQRDKTLATSWYGLARICQEQARYREALEVVNSALALEPASSSAHFLKGQVLRHLDRETEAAREFEEGRRLADAAQDEIARQASGQTVRDPQTPDAR